VRINIFLFLHASDCCLTQSDHIFSSYILARKNYFWWDDDEICFLPEHTRLGIHSASHWTIVHRWTCPYTRTHYPDHGTANVLRSTSCCLRNWEATNTNYIVISFYKEWKKSLKILKGQSESVYRRRTDNTMAKRKKYHKSNAHDTHTLTITSTRWLCHSCPTTGSK
jgi:hypothetical protein